MELICKHENDVCEVKLYRFDSITQKKVTHKSSKKKIVHKWIFLLLADVMMMMMPHPTHPTSLMDNS